MDGPAEKYLFHDYELDPVHRVLRHRGKAVTVSPKGFDILVELIRRRGEVVSKEQLLDRIWHDRFVEENNLTVQISALRKLFGGKKGENAIIVTIPGTGYSFVAPVESVGHSRSLPAERTEVPAAYVAGPDALIGRDAELAEIGSLLEQGTRLITLTGVGGCGKTRLAVEAANRFADQFDATHMVELAEVRDAGLVAYSIVEQLGVRQQQDASPVERLGQFFGNGRTLLVLDNFEQVLDAAGLLKDLLAAAPGLVVLVTSRARLRLRDEVEFKVGPLEVPSEDAVDIADAANGPAAVRLFMIRAVAARRTFVLDDLNAAAVSQICRRLDGMPLAIELAAARIKFLSPNDILTRLQRSLDLLTGGGPELPDRQRTLRNTLEWSYGLLSEDEQRAFRSLAVFGGGFSIDAAEEVLRSAEGPYSSSVLDLVTSLADSGLLTVRDLPDGTVRVGMLEIVREFALEHLAAAGEMDARRQSHAEYFVKFAETTEPHLTSRHAADWTGQLNREIDNVRTAVQYALDADGAMAARLVSAVRYYWINGSQLAEGCYWLERALAVSGEAHVDVRFKLMAGLASL